MILAAVNGEPVRCGERRREPVRTSSSMPVHRLHAPHRQPPLGLALDGVPIDAPATRARRRRTPSASGCRGASSKNGPIGVDGGRARADGGVDAALPERTAPA
jgi:hypothetical protein